MDQKKSLEYVKLTVQFLSFFESSTFNFLLPKHFHVKT